MRRPVLPSVEELLDRVDEERQRKAQACGIPDDGRRRVAVLEGIVDHTNVGAIFRSAAALGIDGVILTKGCSNPLYRRAIRVSMGTVFQVPWTFFDPDDNWPEDGMTTMKNLGFKTAAMALTDNSVSIDNEQLMSEEKLAIILGTEGEGLLHETIEN